MQAQSRLASTQRGSTLIISLILLVILMLFGISAINTGLVNLRISRNTQIATEAQMAAQRVIDAKVSDLASFTSPASAVSTVNVDATGGGTTYSVNFLQPDCVYIRPAPGYSYALSAQAPKDTTWRLVAIATDPGTGASVEVRQGVKVRLSVNATCP